MPASVPTETVQLDHRFEHQVTGVVKAERAPLPQQILVARRVGVALLGVQLMAMVGFSVVLYRRYDLTRDYAQYAQAWYAIAHGHLNPYDSVFHYPFWQSSGELVLWPLALLYFVFPHAVDLLVVQDLVVVGTELVAFLWVIEVLQRARPAMGARAASMATVAVAVALVADPWVYNTIAFDVHTEPLAALFLVLAGRDLWRGRPRRLVWWVIGALACNALAGLYLAAIGVSGLLTGHGRRLPGAALVVVGLAWLAVFSALAGHVGGPNTSVTFSYLTGHPGARSSMFAVAAGALTHPGLVLAHIAARWHYLLVYLGAVGLVGIASPWGLPMAIAVFVPSLLAVNPAFIGLFQAFQQWPALPFVLVGTVMVMVGLRRHRYMPTLRATIALAGALVAMLAVARLPEVVPSYLAVRPAAARTLAHLHGEIAPEAEVIASQGVAGRFADRKDVEAFAHPNKSFPITAHTVVFIITATQGVGEPWPAATQAAVRTIEHLGAQQILARHGIDAFVWHPLHQRRIVLP